MANAYYSINPPRFFILGPFVLLQFLSSPPSIIYSTLVIIVSIFLAAMLDNGSAVSLASSTESGSGRMKDRGWRKPVPKFIPDPPRRFSPLSESMVFRQFAGVKVPYTEQDHPPVSSVSDHCTLYMLISLLSYLKTGGRISRRRCTTRNDM